MNEWMNGWMGGWKNEEKDGWMDGWTDERTDGRTDGWMGGYYLGGWDRPGVTYLHHLYRLSLESRFKVQLALSNHVKQLGNVTW